VCASDLNRSALVGMGQQCSTRIQKILNGSVIVCGPMLANTDPDRAGACLDGEGVPTEHDAEHLPEAVSATYFWGTRRFADVPGIHHGTRRYKPWT